MTDWRDVLEVLKAQGHPALVTQREGAAIERSFGHNRVALTGDRGAAAVPLTDIAVDLARFLDRL